MATVPDNADEWERTIGTVVKLLYRRAHHRAVSTILGADEITLDYAREDWGKTYNDVFLRVDSDLFDELTDTDVFNQIQDAFNAVWASTPERVESVQLIPSLVDGNWRENVAAMLRPEVSNQASLAPLTPASPRQDNLSFRDRAEVNIYEALKRKQLSLHSDDTLAIAPNPGLRIPGRTWEPDFLVVYRGRAGIIEVDGTSHRKKWASDRSRDERLNDAGVRVVSRIDVADAERADEAEQFIVRFLAKLMRDR